MIERDPRPTCFDLFAGAGGFSLGLESSGFRSVGAIEIDDVAAGSYRANLGDEPALFLGSREGDIEQIKPSEIKARLSGAGVEDLDLLVASPPCQGFSRVGRAKLDSLTSSPGSFAYDNRNGLYLRAIDVLDELRPKYFALENVPGIIHIRGTNVAEIICAAIESSGYVARCAILNSAWYGVPQTRERIVILASRADLSIEPCFPKIRHDVLLSRGHLSNASLAPDTWAKSDFFVSMNRIPKANKLVPTVTVDEAFDDLPVFTDHLVARNTGVKYSARREEFEPSGYRRAPRNPYCRRMRFWSSSLRSEVVTDHFCRWTPRDFDIFARMKPGDRYPEAVAIAERLFRAAVKKSPRVNGSKLDRGDFIPPYNVESFAEKWRKLDGSFPSWTVTAHLSRDGYSHIHPDSLQARTISPREAARLQSFPDAFVFDGNTGDVFRQIGNAVPPLLAEAIGFAIIDQISAASGGVVE